MDAAQASPVSASMAVSREQNDHPLVPLFGSPIEIDDEAVAVVGESSPCGNTKRGPVDPPGAVLHNRPAAEAFPGSCGHDGRGQSPAAGPRMGEHADGRHPAPCTQAGDS
jgi:hypothetical protein